LVAGRSLPRLRLCSSHRCGTPVIRNDAARRAGCRTPRNGRSEGAHRLLAGCIFRCSPAGGDGIVVGSPGSWAYGPAQAHIAPEPIRPKSGPEKRQTWIVYSAGLKCDRKASSKKKSDRKVKQKGSNKEGAGPNRGSQLAHG